VLAFEGEEDASSDGVYLRWEARATDTVIQGQFNLSSKQ